MSLLRAIERAALLRPDEVQQADVTHGTVHDLALELRATRGVAEKGVDFVEGATRSLGHEEVHVRSANHAHQSEEDVRAVGGGLDEIWCGHGHRKIIKPVRGRADGDTLGTQAEREDLGDGDPGDGTPREAEENGEEPDEDNLRGRYQYCAWCGMYQALTAAHPPAAWPTKSLS
jgi:hypothetical protein